MLCFFREVIEHLRKEEGARVITVHKEEGHDHPLYEITVEGRRLAVFHPGVGAPLAAALLDEVIAGGCSALFRQ